MAENLSDRTERATPKRLNDAWSKGQFARTIEVQTVIVLTAGFATLTVTGGMILQSLTNSMKEAFGNLGHASITASSVESYFAAFVHTLVICVGPVLGAAVVAGVIAGGMQSRFHLTTERLGVQWERLNPVANITQLFALMPSLMRLGVSLLKFFVVFGFTYFVIKRLIGHPIFYTATGFDELLRFMADAVESITIRVLAGLAVVAAADYGYQFWKTQKDLMMTKEEVKDETKNAEGSPQVKGEIRRRRFALMRQHWTKEIPKADVIVTNPTHLSIALRYDRKTMRAPKVIAKGARLNALRIRELAKDFQIPIVENKPLAQFLFKNCKPGQEVPAEMYAAVAEILAFVYRTNRFRYYAEGRQIPA